MKKASMLAIGALCALAASVQASDQAHWSYQGKTAPPKWAELDEANKACKFSKEQSPINIETGKAKKAKLAPIDFKYVAGAAEVVNNGHTIQINLPEGGSAKIGDMDVKLLQFHFHTPSEEKVNGKTYPLVAHMVHKSADGKLAVVAVLMNVGKENATLKPVFDALPAEGTPTKLASMNPSDLLPANKGYYKFMGSLTTPPCSDGVFWQVLKQPIEISKEQLAAFQKMYKMNARPVQPLNGRVVEVSE